MDDRRLVNRNVTLVDQLVVTLQDFIKCFEANVPEEYRDTAVISPGVWYDYGDEQPYIMVSYLSPETDEEYAFRKNLTEQKKSEERRLYERLHAKYGKQ
jgi:hypothetical protein